MAKRTYYTVTTAKKGLRLRDKPDTGGAILRIIPNGERVAIDRTVETPDGWAAIRGGGYVMSQYLK